MRPDRGLLAQVGEQRRALDRLGREREHRHVAQPDHGGRRAHLAQPIADGEPVQPLRVGMRPRVVGVDRRGQRAELRLRAIVRLLLGPGQPVPEHAAEAQHPGVLAGQRRERVDEREPELVHEPAVRRVPGPDDLAAELDEPAVGELGLLHPPAGPVARLEHDHVGARGGQVARGRQAGQPGAQHGDVVAAHARIMTVAARAGNGGPARALTRARRGAPRGSGRRSRPAARPPC